MKRFESNIGNDDIELEDCPFCGNAATFEDADDHHGEFFSLGCSKRGCPASDAYYTAPIEELAAAIAAWNSRPNRAI